MAKDDPRREPAAPVLVTGATGFLGSHLTPILVERGLPVRVLTRSPDSLPPFGGKVEVVTGEVESPESLGAAVAGVRQVFHLAGRVSRDPEDADALRRVHVEGTRHLVAAAREAGVRRLVLVSTSGTIAVSEHPEPDTDEEAPAPIRLIGRWPYYRSKWLQEETLRSAAGEDLETVIVNPSLLLGPGDRRLSSTGDVLRFLSGQISVVPPGGLNFVDVRDAAAATVAAMDKGRAGERYLLGGENWTFREFFANLAEVSGAAAPRLSLPKNLYTAGGLLTEELARQFGREPAVDRISREMAGVFWYFRSDKAARELGHDPREGRATLRDTVRWLENRD